MNCLRSCLANKYSFSAVMSGILILGVAVIIVAIAAKRFPSHSEESIQVLDDPYGDVSAIAVVKHCAGQKTGEVCVAVRLQTLKKRSPGNQWNNIDFNGDVFECAGRHAVVMRWDYLGHGPRDKKINPTILNIATDCDSEPHNPQILFEAIRASSFRIRYEAMAN